ncbi:myb/SANT-like DNA-binding domain-containing protein 1 [Ochlerotatus camptorhynchus]|uniref:myb/SANT-like DNA-binding domain-containing protein 1 n=1 Tax=Ochlerotatus camptorhynchus TaxID=644619 RepID=UPI0031D8F646
MEEPGPSKRKKSKKHNVWSAPQVDLLLEAWEDKISDLRGTRKNTHVYEEIRKIFTEHGYSVSGEDIKIRINNLTARYRKEKALVGPSGGSPSEWPLFDKINSILGSFRIHNAQSVMEDSIVEVVDCK